MNKRKQQRLTLLLLVHVELLRDELFGSMFEIFKVSGDFGRRACRFELFKLDLHITAVPLHGRTSGGGCRCNHFLFLQKNKTVVNDIHFRFRSRLVLTCLRTAMASACSSSSTTGSTLKMHCSTMSSRSMRCKAFSRVFPVALLP